jgi:SAM-dependent methyltransferase
MGVAATTPYDCVADTYDLLFGNENAYYGPITQRERLVFDRFVSDIASERYALDVGCGTGLHTQWLAEKGFKTIGIDISSEMLRVARHKLGSLRHRVEFVQCDAVDLSGFGWQRFDVVTCLGSSLNHIANWDQFIGQVALVLRQGGVFVFSFDTILGVDTLWSLLEIPGSESLRRLLENTRCALRGRPFHNHWPIVANGVGVEIPLTYESTRVFRRYLKARSLNMHYLTGVHLTTCLSRIVLRASYGAHLSCQDRRRRSGVLEALRTVDRRLFAGWPSACANAVGAARKM